MGMLGMIIALPLTTLMLSYYQRYIINQENIYKAETTEVSTVEGIEEKIMQTFFLIFLAN